MNNSSPSVSCQVLSSGPGAPAPGSLSSGPGPGSSGPPAEGGRGGRRGRLGVSKRTWFPSAPGGEGGVFSSGPRAGLDLSAFKKEAASFENAYLFNPTFADSAGVSKLHRLVLAAVYLHRGVQGLCSRCSRHCKVVRASSGLYSSFVCLARRKK